VHVPTAIAADPSLCDPVIDACRDYAAQRAADEALTKKAFRSYIAKRVHNLPSDDRIDDALFDLTCAFHDFIRQGRDTIQAYVLKNSLRPLFLRQAFHVVIGNPPWLSFRFIQAPDYQAEIRELLRDYGLPAGGHLATHMELAALFLLRCGEWYLSERGVIAFVMPRSIFTADQHSKLRTGKFKRAPLVFSEAWDLENVQPLFKVPACVLVSQKHSGGTTKYPLRGVRLSGELPRRNASPQEAEEALREESIEVRLNIRGRRTFWAGARTVVPAPGGGSPYGKQFVEGASVVPRTVWFVEVVRGPLGVDEARPPVRTSPDIYDDAKKPWDEVRMEGQIEAEFLYPVVLSKDLVPFGIIEPHQAVLPILPEGDHYRVLTAEEASNRGYELLASWLREAQERWQRGRGAKAERFSVVEWLDWRSKLSDQPPTHKADTVRVLVPMSGSKLAAAVLCDSKPVVDYKLFWAAMPRPEAHYLAAICNAPVVTRLVEPMQARGRWGARHFCKKVWELPIPPFDASEPLHRRLSELGQQCAERVAQWLAGAVSAASEEERQAKIAALRRNVGRTRNRVREHIAAELQEIDGLVGELLGGGA